MMKVSAIKCPKCEDVIYSRTSHDMRECSCRSVAIDGGRSYTKVTFNSDLVERPEVFMLDVDSSAADLYRDWNESYNEYGIIRGKK